MTLRIPAMTLTSPKKDHRQRIQLTTVEVKKLDIVSPCHAEHPVYLTPDYSSIRDPLGQDTEEEEDEEDDSEEEGDEEEDDDQVYEEDEDWEHEAGSLKVMFKTEFTELRGCQRWCQAFYDHLQGLEGKTLSEQNANQCTRQVFTILHSIDPRSDTLDCLHKEKGSKIWEEWAKPKLENKTKAGTVISYLT